MPNTQSVIPPLEVVIRKRDRLVFEGQAFAITSVNQKGTFDILPEHANFITVIKDYLTNHKLDKTEQKIELKNGVIHSADNKITAYLDTLTTPVEEKGKSDSNNVQHPEPHS